MSHLLYHFSFQAARWNGIILFTLALVWASVLACVISSIFSQPFDRKQRTFWIAIVILLPFLGVLSYLPFAFNREELPHMFLRKSKRHKKKQASESSAEP